ncbi:hypothetical protein NQ318_021488, partial [Aromia moschata]
FCLSTTYFLWNGDFYEQKNGAAMGSPLSPVIANLFMEAFEEEAIRGKGLYVDYTFIIWPHGISSLTVFFDYLNTLHSNIKFTMETEKDGVLPFLDVLVKRTNNNKLAHGVYRKKTHTDRYLNAASHHTLPIKTS